MKNNNQTPKTLDFSGEGKMSMQEMGQKIKAAYPAYKDWSDESVAKAMIEKDPSFKEFVVEETPKKKRVDGTQNFSGDLQNNPINSHMSPIEMQDQLGEGQSENKQQQSAEGDFHISPDKMASQIQSEANPYDIQSIDATPPEDNSKGFFGKVGDFFKKLPLAVGIGSMEMPTNMYRGLEEQSLKVDDLLGKIPGLKDWAAKDQERIKGNIEKNKKYAGLESVLMPKGAAGVAGNMIPMIGLTAAAVASRNPYVMNGITASFGEMGFGEGAKAYEDYKQEQGQPISEKGKLGMEAGYALAYTIPIGEYIGSSVSKVAGKYIPDALTAVFKSNPEATSTLGKDIMESFAKKSPSLAKKLTTSLAKSSAKGALTMEAMDLMKQASDAYFADHKITKEEFWNRTIQSLGTGALFGALTGPFAEASGAAAIRMQREQTGTVTLTADRYGNPVEILSDKNGNNVGVTPNGKRVNVDQDMIKNSITMSTDHFNKTINAYKTSRTIPTTFDRDAYESDVLYGAKKIAHNGVIQAVKTPKGNGFLVGVQGKESAVVYPDGSHETLSSSDVKKVGNFSAQDFHAAMMKGYDEMIARKSQYKDAPSNLPVVVKQKVNTILNDEKLTPDEKINQANKEISQSDLPEDEKISAARYAQQNAEADAANIGKITSEAKINAQQKVLELHNQSTGMVDQIQTTDGKTYYVKSGKIQQDPLTDEISSDPTLKVIDQDGNPMDINASEVESVKSQTIPEAESKLTENEIASKVQQLNQAKREAGIGTTIKEGDKISGNGKTVSVKKQVAPDHFMVDNNGTPQIKNTQEIVNEVTPADKKQTKQPSDRSSEKNSKFVKNQENEISQQVSRGDHQKENKEAKSISTVSGFIGRSVTEAENKRKIGEGNGKKFTPADRREIESWAALKYAKENNLWIKDIHDLGQPFSSGDENTNVVDIKDHVVYKSNNLAHSQSISNLFEQVKLHNKLFPDTKYDFVGFTGLDNGEKRSPYIEPVFKQKLIDESVPATPEEINNHMEALGFKKIGNAKYANGKYVVSDLFPRNVLKDEDGDIYVIDGQISEAENVDLKNSTVIHKYNDNISLVKNKGVVEAVDKDGVVASKATTAKAITDYRKKKDFDYGEKSFEVMKKRGVEPSGSENPTKLITDFSENPAEILQEMAKTPYYLDPESLPYKDRIIAEFMDKIKPSSFERFGDRTHITPLIKRFYLRKEGKTIDQIQADIDAEHPNLGVTTDDIVNFIKDYPTGPQSFEKQKNPDYTDMQNKFVELTGIAPTKALVERYADKPLKDNSEVDNEKMYDEIYQEELKNNELSNEDFYNLANQIANEYLAEQEKEKTPNKSNETKGTEQTGKSESGVQRGNDSSSEKDSSKSEQAGGGSSKGNSEPDKGGVGEKPSEGKNTAEQKRIASEIDAKIAEIDNSILEQKKLRSKKEKELQDRNGLFGDTKQTDSGLFGEDTFSPTGENVNAALKPFENKISSLEREKEKLLKTREDEIEKAGNQLQTKEETPTGKESLQVEPKETAPKEDVSKTEQPKTDEELINSANSIQELQSLFPKIKNKALFNKRMEELRNPKLKIKTVENANFNALTRKDFNKKSGISFNQEVNNQVQNVSNELGQPIRVTKTQDGFPESVKAQIPEGETVQGAIDPKTGEAWVASDNIDSPAEARAVAFHELVGHKGMMISLGPDYENVMNGVYTSMPKEDVERLSEAYHTKDPNQIAEEYVAEMAESEKQPNWFQRVIARIRKIVRKVWGLNYSKNDILYLLKKSRDALKTKTPSGEAEKGQDVKFKIQAKKNNPDNDPTHSIFGLKGAFNEIEDKWFGAKEWAEVDAMIDAANLQERIKEAFKNHKSFGARNWKDVEKAIHIYIDKLSDPEAVKEHWDKFTPEQKRKIRLADNLTPEMKDIAHDIKRQYDIVGQYAKDNGVILDVIDNYVRRLWDMGVKTPEEFLRKFGTTTMHSKKRTLGTILEGWSKGYELRTEGATPNLYNLRVEIANVVENKNLIERGLSTTNDQGLPVFTLDPDMEGYSEVKHPNFKKWDWDGQIKKLPTEEEMKQLEENPFAVVDDEGLTILPYHSPDVYITPNGTIFRKKSVYAPDKIAKKLNSVLGSSKIKGIKAIDALTEANAIGKQVLLSYSFYHHLAFTRSFIFASAFDKAAIKNPAKAYKEGLKVAYNKDPIFKLLVENGMTVGKMQDWDESHFLNEKNRINRILEKSKVGAEISNKISALHEAHTNFLFKKYGAGLKIYTAMLEMKHLMNKYPDVDPGIIAQRVGKEVNADYGGMNLNRLHRNPTIQHIFRLFALAPDWTESNIHTMIGMFKNGMEGKMYRRFWMRVLLRGALLSFASNALMAMFNDPEDKENYVQTLERMYSGMFKEPWRLNWMGTDITPIYRKLESDKYKEGDQVVFNVMGHFADPFKFIARPLQSAKNKGSIITRMFLDAMSGENYQGKRYTTAPELLGIDKKGVYSKSYPKKGIRVGDPKGGRLTGHLNKWAGPGESGAVKISEIPSFALDQIRNLFPIPVSNTVAWTMGDIDGFTTLTHGIGLHISWINNTKDYEDEYKKAVQEAEVHGLMIKDALQHKEFEKAQKLKASPKKFIFFLINAKSKEVKKLSKQYDDLINNNRLKQAETVKKKISRLKMEVIRLSENSGK